MLGGSGHNAGVINPPAANKHGYWTSDARPGDGGGVAGGRDEARGVVVAALGRVADRARLRHEQARRADEWDRARARQLRRDHALTVCGDGALRPEGCPAMNDRSTDDTLTYATAAPGGCA